MENSIQFSNKTVFLRRHPEYIKYTFDIVDILYKSFSIDFDRSEVMAAITCDPIEELEKMHKKHVKSTKRKKVTFQFVDENGEKIKRPRGAYHLWCKEEFIPSLSKEEKKRYIRDAMGPKNWEKLTKKEKQKWVDKHKEMIEEYEKKKNIAFQKAIDDGTFIEPKPKRPVSGFLEFTTSKDFREHLDSVKFANGKERSKYIASKWRSLTDEERQGYEDIYKKNAKEYKKTLEAYELRVKERAEKIEEEKNKELND